MVITSEVLENGQVWYNFTKGAFRYSVCFYRDPFTGPVLDIVATDTRKAAPYNRTLKTRTEKEVRRGKSQALKDALAFMAAEAQGVA